MNMRRIYLYIKRTYHELANLLWRILEVHMSKIIVIFIIVVCTYDVCALNVLLLLVALILYPLNFHHTLSILTMFYSSFIIITRMVYQLSIFEEKTFTTECLFKQAEYDVIAYNGTVSAVAYFGYRKTNNIFFEVKLYVCLVILLALEMVISTRQKQHYNHPRHLRPYKGVIFYGVNRGNADVTVTSWLKFFANYGFYKFGKEICFIFVVIVMTTRLDAFSLVHGLLLGCLIFLRRWACRRVWPVYIFLLIIAVFVQYLSCLGLPKSLCIDYPWNLNGYSKVFTRNLKVFLFLPDYVLPPYALKIIGCSYLDYVKVGVFYYSFWLTLLILFIAGTFRVNLLCLGYLLGCFFFLWHGQSLLLKPLKHIKKMANHVVLYFLCYHGQVCFAGSRPQFDREKLGFAWDAMGFAMVLLLLRIHKSWFFQHVVNELHVDSVLASRGSELIVEMTQRRIETQRKYEMSILDKIRLKVERIRENLLKKQEATNQPIVQYADHYQVIRSGDYYMFEHLDLDSNSSEVKDEDILSTEAQKKMAKTPTVAELFNIVSIANMETAIKFWSDWMRENRPKNDGEKKEGKKRDVEEEGREGDGHGVEEEDLQEGTSDGTVIVRPHHKPVVPENENLLAIIKDVTGAKNLVPSDVDPPVKQKRSVAQTIRISFYFGYIVTWAGAEQLIVFLNSLAQDYISISDILFEEKQKIKKATILYRSNLLSEDSFHEEPADWASHHHHRQYTDHQHPHSPDAASPIDDDKAVLTTTTPSTTADQPPQQLSFKYKLKTFDPFTEIKKIAHLLQSSSAQDLASSQQDQPQTPTSQPPSLPPHHHHHLALPLVIFNSCYTVFLSNSELLCYFAMVLNAIVYGSILSVVYPVTAILWAMMTCPRPSKRFWLFAIGYTEICIIVKYVYKFVSPYTDQPDVVNKDTLFQWPYMLGLANMTHFDIFLLFCLFFHRSVLMMQPKQKLEDPEDEMAVLAAPKPSRPAPSPSSAEQEASSPSSLPPLTGQPSTLRKRNVKKFKNKNEKGKIDDGVDGRDAEVVDGDAREKKSDDIKLKSMRTITFDGDDDAGAAALAGHDDDDNEAGDDDDDEESGMEDELVRLCCENPLIRPLYNYCNNLRDQSFRAATDVYVFMFLTDLITFLIAVFGFSSFGPNDASANNDGKVTTVLKSNKVFLKFIFQIFLVVLIHAWIFIGLPEVTQRRFVNNVAAQIWYFVKCVYFVLSAYQIRSGYPTCVLGNFLTKKYNYFNLFSFQAFLAIPYLLELRALMDWMFTDTTLSLSSWLQMEDIYANVFCVKCNRSAEKRYKTPRGNKRAALVKYGLGGIILVALVIIIWFPLLLFSMSNAIFLTSQPSEVYVDIKIAGYEELFKMTSQAVDPFTSADYDYFYMKNSFFMTQYQTSDICNVTIKGESGSVWSITPPALNDLVKQLERKDKVNFIFSMQVRRDPKIGGEITYGQFKRALDRNNTEDAMIRDGLINLIRRTSNESVTLMNVFPRLILVPAKGVISSVERSFVKLGPNDTDTEQTGSLKLTLHSPSNFTYWWSIQQYFNTSDDEFFMEDPTARANKNRATPRPIISTTIRPLMRTIPRTRQKNVSAAPTHPHPATDYGGMPSVVDTSYSVSKDKLQLTMFNERVAPSGVLSIINNYGHAARFNTTKLRYNPHLTLPCTRHRVIGLYVSLVLVIGRFLRMYIQGLSFKIMFVELPDPQVLLTLCQDIYMVRESKEFRLEEELFSQLIFLYRSPETLIKLAYSLAQ
ncbi:hypothetical protein HELRODRAFT_190815 [Helobdella robusta]|uniref:Piezo non-specific cation channel R-Ras-binding domain-containing protein n=1 Tax=Helobdella robusta TaxID=6412 RepID=T1FSB3_HELRO|nr:hypothetical protein HELRODRAFT_190815 [Helobdella robusta]ESO07927.1 hypothetical protein HELRODRAFT_190815 [Helobdella robusta]